MSYFWHINSTRKQLQLSECDNCRATLYRPIVCLQCNFAGCWKEGHIQAHVKSQDHIFCKLHILWQEVKLTQFLLGVDVRTGNVFCVECDDFILHSGLESVYDHTILRLEEKSTVFRGIIPLRPCVLRLSHRNVRIQVKK
jgi:ubiquitin carboxyl-terminal hydrolase 22/27/51